MDCGTVVDDPFDRQRCIDGWKNDFIEQQVALVLGVGGLGCTVAFTLARLGIKKMILWDFDTVDVTNLNRQILFGKRDVGRTKVDAAFDGVAFHCVGETIVCLSVSFFHFIFLFSIFSVLFCFSFNFFQPKKKKMNSFLYCPVFSLFLRFVLFCFLFSVFKNVF